MEPRSSNVGLADTGRTLRRKYFLSAATFLLSPDTGGFPETHPGHSVPTACVELGHVQAKPLTPWTRREAAPDRGPASRRSRKAQAAR